MPLSKAPIRPAVLCCLLAALGAGEGLAADAAAGRQKAKRCASCHGIDGIAKIPIAPHLAGEGQIYLETQLKAFRSGKRENEIMSLVAAGLSDQDIGDLAAWYSSIEIRVTLPE